MTIETETRVGEAADKAFAVLGNETRLAILYALWDAYDPTDAESDALSFSELRTRVGMRDGSQFNFHLQQLVGRFVRHTDDGYALRNSGKRIIRTILAGALTDDVVFEAEPIDDPCPICGGQVVMDYGRDLEIDGLLVRCTACEGAWKEPGLPSGALRWIPLLLPVGVRERSLPELYLAQSTWVKYKIMSIIEGVCPECSGTVTTTVHVCADHAVCPGRVCTHCDRIFEVQFQRICNVCRETWNMPSGRHILMHPTVAAFYHDHGYEPWGHNWHRVETETIADQTVVVEDPLTIEVTVIIDDDHLVVTLNGEGAVTDV